MLAAILVSRCKSQLTNVMHDRRKRVTAVFIILEENTSRQNFNLLSGYRCWMDGYSHVPLLLPTDAFFEKSWAFCRDSGGCGLSSREGCVGLACCYRLLLCKHVFTD